MATRTPQDPNSNDVGTFVSTTAIGFVLASAEETAAITKQMKIGSAKGMTRRFVDDLLVIKLLAPSESSGLLIHPVPMIQNFVSGLKNELLMAYYLQQGER